MSKRARTQRQAAERAASLPTAAAVDEPAVMLAKYVAHLDDPLLALEVVAELRAELDRVQAVQVHRARLPRHGATWGQIGAALGVTPQAVSKRYGSA